MFLISRKTTALAVAAAAMVALTACAPSAGVTPAPAAAPPTTTATVLLAQLVIEEEDAGAHYKRAEWDQGWEYDGNGCNTRDHVLFDQGRDELLGKGCKPLCPEVDHTGRKREPCWTSPYDQRQTRHADDLEIDHRVALKEANRSRIVGTGTGAGRVWSTEDKRRFFLDPDNLVAVTAALNQSKGDRDPARWQPAHGRCAFAKAYATTKIKYHLAVDQREYNSLRDMLNTCPAESTADVTLVDVRAAGHSARLHPPAAEAPRHARGTYLISPCPSRLHGAAAAAAEAARHARG